MTRLYRDGGWPGRVFVALVTLLIGVGVLRPVLGWSRPTWLWAVGLLAACAAATAVVRALGEQRGDESRPGPSATWLFAFLPLALALLYAQPQRVASDGIFYYAPLRSAVVDFDLDFENEYRVLGALPIYFQETATGRLPNHHSVGPALLWLPFFLAAHALGLLGLYRATGFGYPYFTAIATGTLLIGFAGVLCLHRLASVYVRDRAAVLLGTLAAWLATFHLWYMVFEPSMAHAMAMTSVAALFLWCHRSLSSRWDFAIGGALAGLVTVIRWQNVIFVPVALALSWARRGAPKRREILLAAAAFAVAIAPQLAFWKAIYGEFLLIPQGGGYLDWTSPKLGAVLFSSRHGLLSWSPVLWLGLVGLVAFVRRERVFGSALLLSGAAALYVNAAVEDWWAGASFGARRFDGVLPAFALGLAVFCEWLLPRIRRRPAAFAALLLVPFVVWNGMLMGVYFSGAIPPDGPASFRQVAGDGAEIVYRYTGYPFSWPAALVASLRTGRPLAAYDLGGALTAANNVDVRMGDTDALYLGAGWTLPRRGRSSTWREIAAERAEVYVALREPAPYTLTLTGAGGRPVELRWNGELLGRVVLSEGEPRSVAVPASRVRAGINAIEIGRVERRGPSPRLIRLVLTRPGDGASANEG